MKTKVKQLWLTHSPECYLDFEGEQTQAVSHLLKKSFLGITFLKIYTRGLNVNLSYCKKGLWMHEWPCFEDQVFFVAYYVVGPGTLRIKRSAHV